MNGESRGPTSMSGSARFSLTLTRMMPVKGLKVDEYYTQAFLRKVAKYDGVFRNFITLCARRLCMVARASPITEQTS